MVVKKVKESSKLPAPLPLSTDITFTRPDLRLKSADADSIWVREEAQEKKCEVGHNHLASLASTGKTFAQSARAILRLKTFRLSICNEGLALEEIQDTSPKTVYCSGDSYRYLNLGEMALQRVEEGTVPGILIFDIFAAILRKLVNVDISITLYINNFHI
jgi:hypothetical protein